MTNVPMYSHFPIGSEHFDLNSAMTNQKRTAIDWAVQWNNVISTVIVISDDILK